MTQLKLFFNQDFRILSCAQDGQALDNEWEKHLLRKHKIVLTEAQQNRMSEILVMPALQVLADVPHPIQGLMLSKGIECLRCDEGLGTCEGSLKNHHHSDHRGETFKFKDTWVQRTIGNEKMFKVSPVVVTDVVVVVVDKHTVAQVLAPDDDDLPAAQGAVPTLSKDAFLRVAKPVALPPAPQAGVHDIAPFYRHTHWHNITATIPEAAALALMSSEVEDIEEPTTVAVVEWWKAGVLALSASPFERSLLFLLPHKLLLQIIMLLCFVFAFSHPVLHEIQQLTSDQSREHPHAFRVLEKNTLIAYGRTAIALVLFLTRLARTPNGSLPLAGNVLQTAVDVNTNVNVQPQLVHRLLCAVFAPWDTEPHWRDVHPLGHFMRLSVVRKNGALASIGAINHTLVHLVFLARLLAFRRIVENPQNKQEILKMVHSE